MGEAGWTVITGITCWVMGMSAGWVIGHRRVPALLARILIQQEVIEGMSGMQDDLVAQLRKIAGKSGPPGVIGPAKPPTTGNT